MHALRKALPVFLSLVLVAVAVAGDTAPLFKLDTKKPAQAVILDEKAGIAVVTGPSDLAAFKIETGEKLFATQDKFATDLFTIIAGQKFVVTAVDKGKQLRAWDLSTGQVAWDAAPPAKLKNLFGVYDTPAGLLLHIENDLYCLDPATGKVLWNRSGLNLAPQVTRDAIYAVTGDFGVRLIALGAPMSKSVHVLDGATGNVLATHSWELGLASRPVIKIGGGRLAILHGGGVSGIDAATGQELWTVEGKLTGNDLMKKLTTGGVSYAMFGFANSIAVVNLDEGSLTYRSGDDLDLAIREITLKNGTLVVTGLRDQTKGKPDEINNNGGFALAYGIDLAAGKLAWGPVVLVNSAMNSLASTTQAIGKFGAFAKMAQGDVGGGLSQMNDTKDEARTPTTYVGYNDPVEIGDDLVFYVYAEDARVVTSNGDSWSEGPGEGLVRLNATTGEVVWRTKLTLFNAWEKPLKKAVDVSEAWSLKMKGLAPQPTFDGEVAYLPAGGSVAKVDLNTGEVLWTGSDHELVSQIFASGDRVAAIVGAGQLSATIDKSNGKLKDLDSHAKVNGVQVLDAANGSEISFAEMKKAPATLFAHVDANALFAVSGETAQRIELSNGKVAWEKPLKKVTGEISGKDGAIVTREEVWMVTGTTSFGLVADEERETEVATAKMALGAFWCKDNSVIVLGPKGPAKIALDGSIAWTNEWVFDPEKTRMAPMKTMAGILCATKSGYQLVSLKDGSTVWTVKASAEDGVAFDSKKTRMFLLGEKGVSAYKI